MTKVLGGAAAHATCRRSWRPWTRCSAASASAPTQTYALLQAPGTAFLVVAAPERGRAARGVVLRRAARRPSGCRWPAWCSTGCTRSAAPGAERLDAALRRPSSSPTWAARRRRPPSRRPRCCALHADQPIAAARQQQLARAVHGRPPRDPGGRGPGRGPGRPRPRRPARRSAAPSPPASGSAPSALRTGRRRSTVVAARAVSSRRAPGASRPGGGASRARRSRSVMPPQTPNSMRLSRASARHSAMTGQPMQTALARLCAAPWTNSASGSVPRHAARAPSPSTQLCGCTGRP